MPLGVVHDSCQIYFPTKYLFDMSDYYFRNLSEYLDGIHHVLYAFDLEIGTNYYDICDLKQLDPTHIQIAGNYVSVKNLVDKCRADGLRFEVESLIMDRKHQDPLPIEVNGFEFGKEFAPDRWTSVVDEFFLGGGDGKFYARFNQDKSSFKMILKKV